MPIQLTPGQVLSREDLCELTNTEVPMIRTHRDYNRHNLALVSAYTNLNKTLRSQGLCIESRNYYTEFHVLAGDDAQKKINSYKNKARTGKFCEVQLRTGIRTFNRNRRNFNS